MSSYSFRDDYSDGAHPDILAAITRANAQQATPYGEDEYTKAARKLIQENIKAPESAVYFVASGTMANILAIGSSLRPHEAVISTSHGHPATHEAGAIEAIGHKIISVPSVSGKLTPNALLQALADNSLAPHMAKPRLVYISNATEVGTFYKRAELEAISTICKAHGLIFFLDGARLGVALSAGQDDVTLQDIAQLTDIFWIGGTKIGAMFGEAIVINTPALREDFQYHIKQRGALLSKGRFLGSQFHELFRAGLFFKLAFWANQMAHELSTGIRNAGYKLQEETETNQIFAILPDELVAVLQQTFSFHVWQRQKDGQSVVRLVTSWSTERSHINAFVGMLSVQLLKPS